MGKTSARPGGKLLSSSRPPRIDKKGSVRSQGLPSSASSKATKALISLHHNLQKRLHQAEAEGNVAQIATAKQEIEAHGGLEAYQVASITGQSAARGGDSSKQLLIWLRELGVVATGASPKANAAASPSGDVKTTGKKQMSALRLLEVGCLKVDNACARSGLFDMTRIDLNSQHPQIARQDFMARPTPTARPVAGAATSELTTNGFDIISLSLVVNYVPSPAERGAMLRHSTSFLRSSDQEYSSGSSSIMPGLFLVLPAPCVSNSRYLTDEHLQGILQSLGYHLVKQKFSNKLVYYYFTFKSSHKKTIKFSKSLLRDGKGMNNFAITMN